MFRKRRREKKGEEERGREEERKRGEEEKIVPTRTKLFKFFIPFSLASSEYDVI